MVKQFTDIKIKYYLEVTIFFCACLIVFPAAAAEKTIGVIMTGSGMYYQDMHKQFVETLSAENLGPFEIILQTPAANDMAWTNAARKLIAIDCDIIVSFGASATKAALDQTSKKPVIYAGVYAPERLGLIKENSVGISATLPVNTIMKQLKSITQFKRLGIVINNEEPDTIVQYNEVKKLESSLGFTSVPMDIKAISDTSKFENIDALFFTTASPSLNSVASIIDLACKLKIPSAAIISGNQENGIVLTISANPQEQGHEAAKMTNSVLRGDRPSVLGKKQFTKVDIVINIKEAVALGFNIPFDLLSSATEIIK